MKRSTVTAVLAAALVLGPVAGTAAAAPGLPLTEFTGEGPLGDLPTGASGSAQLGATGGSETTGSYGNGSFGMPTLERLLLGESIVCGAFGSALALAGEAMMNCRKLPTGL
ncbi:hypothetical protein ACFWUP_22145 [Nocardia sp. NPDC058658]|uniref:hypothetical protein n=1 Tax=Nocardia sp. NPDC058658 TaxID=3346580 RepID=UPI003657F967